MKQFFTLLFAVAFCLQVSADEKYPRKIVMEEGTGTWCGWCVRGIETIKRMSEKYPNNFIGIALHYGDEMDNLENYSPILSKIHGFPGCFINRRSSDYESVSLGSAENAVKALKDEAIAKIEATASFTDATKKKILVNTVTTFGFDDISVNYRIAYVVLEDNVGPYYQDNYYPGMDLDKDDYMYEWTKKASTLSIKFNDVARGIYPSVDGKDGSVPTWVKKNVANSYDYTVTLPQTVANADNVSIVTLLIDSSTGEIVNADKVAMGGSTTSIQTMESVRENEPDVWYNLNGQRVEKPAKGLYIKNGKKVLVK